MKKDKRKESYWGYRLYTNTHEYFKKLEKIFYSDRKRLNKYIVNRLTIESFAHMWMCDGSLEHAINRNTGRIQNIGWIHLLKYDTDELNLIIDKLQSYGIQARICKKDSSRGFKQHIKISGTDLQKFISCIYPYILEDYKYKTKLYYKTFNKVDLNLPNAEQFIILYDNIEDIVRHSWKQEITD